MTAARRRVGDAKVHLLVALPQSGRTRWLAARAFALAEPDGRPPLWVAGPPGAQPPEGVQLLDLPTLLELDPADLAGRVLAFDDLHGVPGELAGPIADAVDAVLAHGTEVLATSLVVPAGPLARWTDHRRIEWHRQADLAVDEDAFVASLVSLGVPVRHARRLHRVVDGWAGPLAAAAESSSARAIDVREVARGAVDRAARDLAPLLDEVGHRTPGLSLLPAVSASLLEAVVAPEVGAEWLGTVQRFVPPALGIDVPLRPHPVLRRTFALHQPSAVDAAQIRERALAWYLNRDRVTDAVRMLIEDQRSPEALELIRAHQLTIWYHDGRGMQRQLMDEMPKSTWSAEDHLLFVVACMAAGDHRRAGVELTSTVLQTPGLPIELAIARDTYLTYLGLLAYPPELCIAAGRRALEALDQIPEDTVFPPAHIAETHAQYRSGTLTYLARNQILLGDWDEALDTLDQAGRCGQPMLDHAWAMYRAWLHGLRGDVSEAQRIAVRALDAADFWPEIHIIAVEARLALFEVHLLQGRLDAALRVAEEAITGAETRRSANQLACALVATAEVQLRLDRPAAARQALDRIGDGAYGFVGRRATALRARSLLAMDEHAEAAVLLQRLPLDQHTIAAHAEGIVAGIDQTVTAEEIAGWEPPPWRSAQHVRDEALSVLARGPMSGAVAPAVDRSTASPTIGRSAAVDQVAAAHGLSDREAETLRALLVDRPLAQVASQLGISPNTLKTHLRRTYRKLGVGSREEAVELVARAELDPS